MAAANLQSSGSIKQLAETMNVSERLVHMAIELSKCERDDLTAKCIAGEISVLGALKIAKPQKYGRPTASRTALLVRAYEKLDPESQSVFLRTIGADSMVRGDACAKA